MRLSFTLYNAFFFNDTATTEIYTLSLHDALPIWFPKPCVGGSNPSRRTFKNARLQVKRQAWRLAIGAASSFTTTRTTRSEEHTSELQSRQYLVCRLLLEKHKPQLH